MRELDDTPVSKITVVIWCKLPLLHHEHSVKIIGPNKQLGFIETTNEFNNALSLAHSMLTHAM